jgi:hypothetical protein
MVENISDMSVIRGTLLSMENRTFTISSGVPAFLAKLWKLVDEPSSDHLISWSQVSFYSKLSILPIWLPHFMAYMFRVTHSTCPNYK